MLANVIEVGAFFYSCFSRKWIKFAAALHVSTNLTTVSRKVLHEVPGLLEQFRCRALLWQGEFGEHCFALTIVILSPRAHSSHFIVDELSTPRTQ